ncbi:DUF1080 domain-containing protein [Stieleria sp. JC731]|uniref:family 16 glycoside hydrolase n=1 Tax=Pirellulaceae TaxID=2691357 RepID=UPI001E50DB13|nr:family 16 glycoside hydrolase [Stieleria sp. JC731]MCC9603926.1 DUF1080 domain-containing protein [Stieleria sp. JC731]
MIRRILLLAIPIAASLVGWDNGWTAEPRYSVLFNGKNLDGWKGDPKLWSVQNGSIVGQTTDQAPIPANTFLIRQDGNVGDFELKCLVRFEGNNSGVQYRSEFADETSLALKGYQADLHPRIDYMGMMYGEKTGRGIIAQGGQRVVIDPDGKPKTTELRGLSDIDTSDWNELRIVAVGNRMIHQINGTTTIDLTDRHPEAKLSGLLGLQLHRGPAMKVEFRSVLYRALSNQDGEQLVEQLAKATKLKSDTTDDSGDISEAPASWVQRNSKPKWIWAKAPKDGQKVAFRKTFNLQGNITAAQIYTTCDNRMQLWINGQSIATSNAWERPVIRSIADALTEGPNTIAIEGQNEGGVAALVSRIKIQSGNQTKFIDTDSSWKFTETASAGWQQNSFDDSKWESAKAIGELGDTPWGVPGIDGRQSGSRLINPHSIYAPPGFVVDRIYEVPSEQGSWVALATDPQGRIYACDQGGEGLFRLTIRDGQSPLVESVSQGALSNLSGAQGLHWAFDSLWFHRNGGHLYRLTDTDGDDRLDMVEEFPGGTGGGEHGNHAVLTTPDGKGLYMVGGNHAPIAKDSNSEVPTWYEGLLLPRMWDSGGHARGLTAPGGWVTRLNIEDKTQTIQTIGFRNEYDIALNRHGDLFTYDADMEWDLGLPWYRPTRICFVAKGADFGWRSGSGKWPAYYEDSLPSVVDIGPGSPTGVISGLSADFPTRYRDAIFAADWTFGTMYAIHLKPDGAGYKGEAEPFVYGSPLPLTDVTIGADRSMYFAIGGRGTRSGLYRVRYVGDQATSEPSGIDAASAKARQQRIVLEAFHGVENPKAIDIAWPHLASNDRYLRHAARIAIESQPTAGWAERIANEANPQARITATVALARVGKETDQEAALTYLLDIKPSSLNEGQMLGLLRAYALIFERLGKPTATQSDAVISQIGPMLPSESDNINTELIRVLTYLRWEKVVPKAMDLIVNRKPTPPPAWTELASRNAGYGGPINRMIENMPPMSEINYAFILRNMRQGWTVDLRRQYFTFLNEAAKSSGGASYSGYLTRMRDEALGTCTDEERKALEDITGESFDPKPDFPITEPVGPGQKWTVDAVLGSMRGSKSFERGRSLFFSAKCASCHRLRGLGGAIGPDLTSIPNKFDERYLAEAIVHPSNHISDQYGSSRVLTDEGRVITGLVVKQDNGDLLVYPVEADAKPIAVEADTIEQIDPSKVSQMPEALLDQLNADEVRDLMTYLMSAGDKNDRRYRQ